MLATTDFAVANKLIADERLEIASISRQGIAGQAASKAGILYLDYLMATWMLEPLWLGWSQKGRVVASVILKIPVDGVLPTTNHLESFNSLLKRKYIPQWQRSGSRLRFDFLIHIFITNILPDIFALRLSNQKYHMWLASRFSNSAGGVDLIKLRKSQASSVSNVSRAALCWWEANERRDNEAVALVHLGKLYTIRQTVSLDRYEATCLSTSAGMSDPSRVQYDLHLHRMGHGYCSCPDFVHRGGACKHLRALRIIIESWVRQYHITPFYYPPTPHAAELLQPPQSSLPATGSQNLPSLHTSTYSISVADHAASVIRAPQADPSVFNNIFALQKLAGDDVRIYEGQDDETDDDAEGTSEHTSLSSGTDAGYHETLVR